MDWTVKTDDNSINVSSVDQLRQTIKDLPPGAKYIVVVNDPPIVMRKSSGKMQKIAMAKSFQGVALKSSPVKSIEESSTPDKSRRAARPKRTK